MLQGWLNRLSNRFRNLKIGRSFNTNNRLAPMGDTVETIQEITITQSHSPKLVSRCRFIYMYGAYLLGMFCFFLKKYPSINKYLEANDLQWLLVGRKLEFMT